METPETLVPFVKGMDGDQPTIIVDSREASTAPKVMKGLREAGARLKIEYIEKGDYILSDRCAVERKTVKDFVYTLTRRYLFEQLFELKEAYPKPFILIEGYFPVVFKFSKVNPSSVWGAMFSLAKSGIALIQTTKYEDTVNFLYVASRQEQVVEKRLPEVHPFKKVESKADAQVFLLSSLPNIGREKAISILKCYSTPLNAFINVDRWAKDVRGLGPKITERCKEILSTAYIEKEEH
ncbi:MAG: ERCC4 domain-containing protein [Candidatus Bathyarchaeia archaeon]